MIFDLSDVSRETSLRETSIFACGVCDIGKADRAKDAHDAEADWEGVLRAFHAAVLDIGEVDYMAMFHVKHCRMSRLSLLAMWIAVMVCGAVIFMMRQRSSGVPRTFRVASSALGVDYNSDVSRETSEELARVIGDIGLQGAEVPRCRCELWPLRCDVSRETS